MLKTISSTLETRGYQVPREIPEITTLEEARATLAKLRECIDRLKKKPNPNHAGKGILLGKCPRFNYTCGKSPFALDTLQRQFAETPENDGDEDEDDTIEDTVNSKNDADDDDDVVHIANDANSQARHVSNELRQSTTTTITTTSTTLISQKQPSVVPETETRSGFDSLIFDTNVQF